MYNLVKELLLNYTEPESPIKQTFEMKLYSDGACNSDSKPNGWASVVSDTGDDIIMQNQVLLSDLKLAQGNFSVGTRAVAVTYFDDVASQQVNGAELIGLIIALRVAAVNPEVTYIGVDSQTVFAWMEGRMTKKTREKMNTFKLQYVEELMKLCAVFRSRGGIVEKINGDDNPADLGYHRK